MFKEKQKQKTLCQFSSEGKILTDDAKKKRTAVIFAFAFIKKVCYNVTVSDINRKRGEKMKMYSTLKRTCHEIFEQSD